MRIKAKIKKGMWEKVIRGKSSTLVLWEEHYTFIGPAICIQVECNSTRWLLPLYLQYFYSFKERTMVLDKKNNKASGD